MLTVDTPCISFLFFRYNKYGQFVINSFLPSLHLSCIYSLCLSVLFFSSFPSFIHTAFPSFPPFFHPSILPSFFSSFLLHSFLSSFLPSLLPSLLPSFLPSFIVLPSPLTSLFVFLNSFSDQSFMSNVFLQYYISFFRDLSNLVSTYTYTSLFILS